MFRREFRSSQYALTLAESFFGISVCEVPTVFRQIGRVAHAVSLVEVLTDIGREFSDSCTWPIAPQVSQQRR